MRLLSRGGRVGSRALAVVVATTSSLLVVAGVSAAPVGAAPAGRAAAAPVCTAAVSAGPGVVVNGTVIVGVVGGSTQVTLDCNQSAQAALAVEATLLASLGAANVVPTGEVDTSALAQFAPSATDTGCPAGSNCESATVAIPATYSASDPNAQCPPTQAQINAGVFGCAIAAVTAQNTPVAGAEFLLQYASQALTTPANPTISALQTTGAPGSTIDVADASGATGYWWGDAIQLIQANEGLAAPATPPTSCAAGGYGNVPTATLSVLWYAPASTTPLVSSPSNLAISNDCYTGKDLVPPALSGTIAVPATAASGTTYEVYVCELDFTPYAGSTTSPCGPAVNGLGWISASFPFTVKAGVISQNLPMSGSTTAASSSHFSVQLVTSGASGAVTYTQSGSSKLNVSTTGLVTTTGPLNAGTYTVSGTTSDAAGDIGNFNFSLEVSGSLRPVVHRVMGTAVPGHLAVLTVLGANFPGRPRATTPGARVMVVRVSKTRIVLRLVAPARFARGRHVMTLRFGRGGPGEEVEFPFQTL
ncbi:MAG TPA: hypothetical protein VFN59_07765 [Acidimicrobiales bacterium]|nr:hypothetical protein [Acidimicrobiales bacterium]